jgi:hypothetical protein
MRHLLLAGLGLGSIFTISAPAQASVVFLAQGQLTGSSDMSGLSAPMENGVAGNILGGLGSGLAYAGGNTYIALPDRGPNATPYNSAVDDTSSFISRFQTLTMDLTAAAPGSALPFNLTPTLSGTTLLFSSAPLVYGTGAGLGVSSGVPAINDASHYYFSGRSDNFAPGLSTNPDNARFDPEGVRVSNDGKYVFISDEYGPYVRQFDRATGQLVKTFTLPANLASPNLSPNGDTEINGNTVGRVANKGMEGLAITPDGKTLVGIMQAALEQDKDTNKDLLRIVTIDIASGQTKEYGYLLTKGSGVSEIVAINNHEFLVDERDGKGLGDGSAAKVKQIYKIDLAGATDITDLNATQATAAAVSKSSTPYLDLVKALTAFGVDPKDIPSKIEGLSFGQDVLLNGENLHTLWIANDNDFLPATAGGNQFYVFGFKDSDMPGFIAQAFSSAVPEPQTWAMMIAGFGMVGASMRRKRRIAVRFA